MSGEGRTSSGTWLLAAGALLGQGCVAVFTWLMGLGWGGAAYTIAVLQSVLAFVLIAWLLTRWRWASLLVPVVSLAVTLGLAGLAFSSAEDGSCSARELSAVADLRPPPGVEVDLRGTMEGQCSDDFTTELTPADVVDHYRTQFAAHHWTEVEPSSSPGVSASQDGVVVDVSVEDVEGGSVLVTVREEPGP